MNEHNNAPHQRNLRGGRWSETFAVYSVTKCVEDRRQLLHDDRCASEVLSSIDFCREQNWIKLLGFCIMPDHFHLLLVLAGERSLSSVMASLCRHSARMINRVFATNGQFWQDGFHDHRCRPDEDLEQAIFYVENNPVRAASCESGRVALIVCSFVSACSAGSSMVEGCKLNVEFITIPVEKKWIGERIRLLEKSGEGIRLLQEERHAINCKPSR